MQFSCSVCFVMIFVMLTAGCSKPVENTDQQETVKIAPAASHDQVITASTKSASVAGIEWAVPERWQPQSERPMRIATYTVPGASKDAEDGECAVFFFGTGQGGDVRSNIERWISQFDSASKPEESSRNVNGIRVTTVSISGNYTVMGGPMMQPQGSKPNYRLLGAIVEAPEGAVFFKTTGPSATILAAEKDFTSLLDSVRKR